MIWDKSRVVIENHGKVINKIKNYRERNGLTFRRICSGVLSLRKVKQAAEEERKSSNNNKKFRTQITESHDDEWICSNNNLFLKIKY